MAKKQLDLPGGQLVKNVPLESGDELVLTMRRLSFVEKAQATEATQATAGDVPPLVQYARTVGGAIVAAELASGEPLAAAGFANDWADVAGQFWAALDAGTAVDLFLALLAHGRLTALEKKESATSPSG